MSFEEQLFSGVHRVKAPLLKFGGESTGLSQRRGGVKVGLINWIRCGINANHPVVADGHDIPSLTKEGSSVVMLAKANA